MATKPKLNAKNVTKRTERSEITCISQLKTKYWIKSSKDYGRAFEEEKQRLIATAGKILRYKERVEQYKQNSLFKNNTKLFYSQVKQKNQQLHETISEIKETSCFWTDIWGKEMTLELKAEWIKSVEHDFSYAYEQGFEPCL